jgi:hypothetical protein
MKVLSETADFSDSRPWVWKHRLGLNTIETRYESESTDDLEQTGFLAQIISKNEIRNVLKPTSIRLLGVSKRYPKDPTLKKVRWTCRSSMASSTLTWSGAVEESIADEDGIHAREVWQSMSSSVYHQSSWGITSTKNGIFVSSVNTTLTHVFCYDGLPHKPWDYDEIVWVDHKMSLTLRSDTHINHFQRGKSHSWLLETVLNPQYNWDWSKVFTKWQQGDSVKSTRAAIVIQSSWRRGWPRRG